MNKESKINKIVSLFESEIADFSPKESTVRSVYHEKIDESYCSEYKVSSPISSFRKDGPHIFFEINKKIGFGLYVDKLNFNNGLYEDGGKYWSEILSPDFFIIVASHINDVDISNSLFQSKKRRLLSGYGRDYDNNEIKEIPIILYKLSRNYSNLRYFDGNKSLLEATLSKGNLSYLQFEKSNTNEFLFYAAGNTYLNEKDELHFSNLINLDGDLKPTTLNLKFFNNVRDLERKINNANNSFLESFSLNSNNENFLFPDLRIKINKKHHLKEYVNVSELNSSLPIMKKTFLKGFFDRNFIYLDKNPYSSEACIKKNLIDSKIKQLILDLGGEVTEQYINVDNSFLEVRRNPFSNGKFLLI